MGTLKIKVDGTRVVLSFDHPKITAVTAVDFPSAEKTAEWVWNLRTAFEGDGWTVEVTK